MHTNLSRCLFPFILRSQKISIFCSSALPDGLHIEYHSKAIWWPSLQFTSSAFSLFLIFNLISCLMSYICKVGLSKAPGKQNVVTIYWNLLQADPVCDFYICFHVYLILATCLRLHTQWQDFEMWSISKWWVLYTALPWDGLFSLLCDVRQWNFLSLDLIFPMCEMRGWD